MDGPSDKNPSPPQSRANGDAEPNRIGDAMREEQAIAQAIMMGEQARLEGRSDLYFYAKRIGLFSVALGIAGLFMLFAYARLSGGDFNPIPTMFGLGILTAGGAVAAYWASTESSRSRDK